MNLITPSRFLKNALYADAAVSAASAVLQLSSANLLAGLLSLPSALLFETGVFMVGYVALLVVMARSQRVWAWLVLAVVAGNVAWALGCLVLPALLPTAPNALGIVFLVLQAAVPLLFAALEWAGLRSSAPTPAMLKAVRS